MGDNLIVWHWVIPPVSLRALPLKGVAISMPLHRDRHVAHAPRDDREKRNRDSEPCPERQQGISLLEITTVSVTNVLDEYTGCIFWFLLLYNMVSVLINVKKRL